MKRIEFIARIVIAIVLGEVILVLGTTLAQETLFGDISWHTSTQLELALGGFFAFLAAVLAGAVAYLLVKKTTLIPIVILSVLVFLETTWLIQSGRSEEPVAVSIMAGGSLILGFWVGTWLVSKLRSTVK